MRILKNKLMAWTLVGAWMGLIFYLSHQPADESSELSAGIMQAVLGVLGPFIPFAEETFHTIIRKTAHVTAYAVLGFLSIHAFTVSGLKNSAFYALLLSFFYAVTDEIHQLFIPGRSGEVSDVLLDTMGALIGIGLYIGCKKVYLKYIYQGTMP
jgi:VanZ family protein